MFHFLILFSDNCSFKKIVVKLNNVSVIKANEMKRFWKAGTEQKISTVEINSIYNTFKQYAEDPTALFQKNMNHATNQ